MFLGIDTSAYTTSVALLDQKGGVCAERRILLPVPAGQQGLQQSKALFFHLRNLPHMLREVFSKDEGKNIESIAVSTRPRPQEDSYMPVFWAGKSIAGSLAAALHVPLIETSHQEGHLEAGLWSVGEEGWGRFLAFHLSGGTSELLLVERNRGPFAIRILGSALDISAGQFIDRVGVAMGLPFPAGPAFEEKAREGQDEERTSIAPAVKGYSFSFSGGETKAKELLKKTVPAPAVARGVEHCIAKTLEKTLRRAIEELQIKKVLVVGGVAANSYIKSFLRKRLEQRTPGVILHFASKDYSSDNAVGVALIARNVYQDRI